MSKLTPKTGTMTTRCRNAYVDSWRTDFMYPLFEFKPFLFYSAPILSRRSVIECFSRGLILSQNDLVSYTVWNTEMEHVVDEVIDG